jgi:hypothetical protein
MCLAIICLIIFQTIHVREISFMLISLFEDWGNVGMYSVLWCLSQVKRLIKNEHQYRLI